ncbi:MAG: hypothetical protein RR959_08520 [Erysipelotrichaceae bacterium]
MSNLVSEVLNGVLRGIIINLSEASPSEDNLENVLYLGLTYQRLKGNWLGGEDKELLQEVVNKLLTAMLTAEPYVLEILSSTFQRVDNKSFL